MTDRVYRIMVVDDEQNIRDGSERILSREGYRVIPAQSGEEALALQAEDPVDIVLLDLKMPGLEGLEVLDRLRSEHPDTMVIIATGFATIETAIEAMKKGAYDFMTKPFRPDQLRLVVARTIEHIRLREERDRLSAERERGLWAITTEKGRLKTVVDSIVAGLIIMDPDGRIVLTNPALHMMTGVRAEDVVGSPIGDYPELETIRELTSDVLDGQSDQSGGLTREFVIYGDKTTYFRATVNAVLSEDDEILGLVAVLRDVSWQKEQEREKEAFVAMLTHELRSPLGAVDTQFHAILKGLAGGLTDKQQDMLSRMQNRVRNVLATINDLLDLSKIEAGRFGEERTPASLAALTAEAVDMLAPQAEEKEQNLTADLDGECPEILMDASRIKDAAVNLISNAIRYSPRGGSVAVEVLLDGDCAVLRVADDGFGIAPQYHDKVFQRFFRVKDERARDVVGTGLGLPIVKAVVEAHGGTIHLDSDEGRGCTFTVRLPLKATES